MSSEPGISSASGAPPSSRPQMSWWHFASDMLAPFTFLLLMLITWESTIRLFEVPTYLVPAPSKIAAIIVEHWSTLTKDALVTLLEALLGFTVGVSSAFVLGVIFVHFRVLERSVSPYFVALQAVPIVAIAPLLIIWFGNGLLSKVIMAAMICFFPMVISSVAGLKNISEDALDLMRLLSASKFQIFFKLRLPASLPFVFSGLKISATLSVIGAVVAELAGATKGIGFQIMVSSYRTDTPMLFSAVLFAALTGILFYYAVVGVERLWRRHRHLLV